MKYTKILILTILAVVVSCQGNKTTTVGTTPEIEKRVEDLLSRMTLAEKIGQMNQVSAGGDVADRKSVV